jgi:hypothetical protein
MEVKRTKIGRAPGGMHDEIGSYRLRFAIV